MWILLLDCLCYDVTLMLWAFYGHFTSRRIQQGRPLTPLVCTHASGGICVCLFRWLQLFKVDSVGDATMGMKYMHTYVSFLSKSGCTTGLVIWFTERSSIELVWRSWLTNVTQKTFHGNLLLSRLRWSINHWFPEQDCSTIRSKPPYHTTSVEAGLAKAGSLLIQMLFIDHYCYDCYYFISKFIFHYLAYPW